MKGLGFRVSENKGYRILGPYNKDPILGNSHIYYQYGSRRPKKNPSYYGFSGSNSITLGIKLAQKLYIQWSLGPKVSIYESLEP